MAWTTPRTWVSSELVTAALMNTHVRDNLVALDAAIDLISVQDARSCACGRLTLESGVPVSTNAQADKGTLYFTPYKGDQLGLYDGAAWVIRTFAELSLSLAGYTASKPYDIWAYDNAGTVTLESTVWTNDTTRATALALQDGVYVKAGTTTRRYLGTIYITAAGAKTTDSAAFRWVWNHYNQEERSVAAYDSTASWTYATAAWRQARASTANQIDFVIGVSGGVVDVSACAGYNNQLNNLANARIGLALDATNTADVSSQNAAATQAGTAFTRRVTGVAAGRHYFAWVEYEASGYTTTWYGASGAGIAGTIHN